MKTLHIYSSSKINLTVFLRNRMKATLKKNFFSITCSEHMYSASDT